MPKTMTIEDDPRIKSLLQSIMDEGSDEFEMVGYKAIRVIQEPAVNFKCLIEVDVVYESPEGEIADTVRAGWNGTYDELFQPGERKSKLLKIFYAETQDLIGGYEEDEY